MKIRAVFYLRMLSCLGMFGFTSSAQAEPASHRSSPSDWSFLGGYTSHDFSHPGLHLGAEYRLGGSRRFESFAAFMMHGYHQRHVHSAVGVYARWGQRYTAPFGLTLESLLGIGLQASMYETVVFEFEDSMASSSSSQAALMALTPHVAFGIGYDFRSLWGLPFHLYARPGVALRYPELNQAFHQGLFAEVGLRFMPWD